MRSYATVQEFQAYPNGLSLDDLVVGGTSAQQVAELQALLQAASSTVDQWCYQPLYAHTRTETKHVRPQQWGTLDVRCDHFPVQSVTSAQWRQTAVGPWHTVDLALVDVLGDLGSGHKYTAADAAYWAMYGWGQPPLTVQSTYIAGYPNMQLVAGVLAGAVQLPVDETLGVAAGDVLRIYDGVSYEEVTVQSTTSNGVDLVSGCLYAHAAGVRVSELPDAVNTACILMASYLIKERRAGASIMMSGSVQPLNVVNSEDMQMVRQFLQPFRRVI